MSYPVTGGWDRDDRLLVELYDSTSGGLPALTTGTFSFGVTPNDDLATCQHCVWLPIDWDGVSPLDRVLFATEAA